MGYPMTVKDPARRHLVRDRQEGEAQLLLPFSAKALTSGGDCCSSASEGSVSAAAERAEPFVGTTEFGEYDSDQEDGESMQKYVTQHIRQLNGIIAGGLDVEVPKERFVEVLLDGSRLSEDERRKVLAGVNSVDDVDMVADALVACYPILEEERRNHLTEEVHQLQGTAETVAMSEGERAMRDIAVSVVDACAQAVQDERQAFKSRQRALEAGAAIQTQTWK